MGGRRVSMSAGGRIAILVALVAGVAALAVGIAVWQGSPSPRSPQRPAAPRSADETARGDAAGPFEGDETAAYSSSSPSDSPAPEAERAAVARTIHARVHPEGPPEPGAATVCVRAAGRDGDAEARVVQIVDRAVNFSVDVTPLFAGRSPPSELSVVVDHPSYERAGVHLPADGPPWARRGERLEAWIDVRLVPAGGIRGYVLFGSDAGPLSGKPARGAPALLFAAPGDLPKGGILASATADHEGIYRIRTRAEGRCLVVASQHGFRPASQLASVSSGGDAWVPALELDLGATISGVVTLAGNEPVAGAIVVATARRAAPDLGEGLRWVQDHAVRAFSEAQTNDTGRFEIKGLESESYRVQIASLARAHPALLDHVQKRLSQDVEAPHSGIDFEAPAAFVDVRVLARDIPMRGIVISAECRGRSFTMESRPDGARLLLLPEAPHVLRVQHPYLVASPIEFDTGAAGTRRTVTVQLEPRPGLGRLAITLRDEKGRSIPRASARVVAGDEAAAASETLHPLRGSDNRFVFEPIASGRHQIEIQPAAIYEAGTRVDFAPAQLAVEVPAGGEREVTVDVVEGGWLRAAARDARGQLLPANCLLRDESGGSPPGHWTRADVPLGKSIRHERRFLSGAPSRFDRPLAPGRYRIELSHEGFEPAHVETTIAAGKTRDVVVTLRERP
jgi:hypothetical protein